MPGGCAIPPTAPCSTAIADRRLADPASDIADLVARLGPEGRAVYDLVANRDPLLVPALIARLPEAIRAELRRLDLKGRQLPFLTGPVFLVHGEDDTMIPAGESVKLAAALGPRAELYLIEHFAHVDAGTSGLGDSVRLVERRDPHPRRARPASVSLYP